MSSSESDISMAEEKHQLHDMENGSAAAVKKRDGERPSGAYERVIQPCVAELVGTAFFVFVGCVSVIENVEAAGRLQPALAHGLAVAVLVACMAEVRSGEFSDSNATFIDFFYDCGPVLW